MHGITSIETLKSAIQILETEQAAKGEILKDQFLLTFESLKPINIIKSTISDITSSPLMLDNILGTAMGLASGYLSKQIVVGSSANLVRRLIGSILQFGVTNIVASHPQTIKSIGHFIFQSVFRSKKNE